MNYEELKTELRNRLSIATGNTFWTDTMLGSWINQANKWACNYKRWPFTEKAKYTTSRADALYYDYPPEFKSDSISRLEIEQDDGTMEGYKKVTYLAFMKYIRDEPDGTDKIFSDFRRQYFINPVVKVNGKEICIWGQEKPTKLVNSSDETPFAEGEEAGEEAIIKKALSIALRKGKTASLVQQSQIEGGEAKEILEQIWARISEEQASYQTKEAPLFDIPRFL
jgi:hypothetical protein